MVSWKGRTLAEVVAMNNHQVGYEIPRNTNNLFLPQPQKGYRKELMGTTTTDISYCNNRRISVDELMRPGGAVADSNHLGLIQSEIDSYDSCCAPGMAKTTNTVDNHLSLNKADQALRRVRSAGMYHTKPTTTTNTNYYTDRRQYLRSRNRAFDQNYITHMRTGNANAKPGCPAAANNTYATNGMGDCTGSGCLATYYKPNNWQFAQQGAVDAGQHILRRKYDTITGVGASYRNEYGTAMANALAYGNSINSYNYTVKDKHGYPMSGSLLARNKYYGCNVNGGPMPGTCGGSFA